MFLEHCRPFMDAVLQEGITAGSGVVESPRVSSATNFSPSH